MAGGTIGREDFRLLMADGLNVIFDEAYEKIPAPQWSQFFKDEPSSKMYEVELGMVGMGLPGVKTELAAPRVDQPKMGRPVRYVHTTYGVETRLSVEAKDDDRYGKLARAIIPEMTRTFGILQEYQHASIFDLGFSAQGYEPDGVSLFNTAHPLVAGGTSSNRSATDAALSYTSLNAARVILRKTLTESRKLTPYTAHVLVVSPSNQTLAEELTLSTLKPGQFAGGTQPNDINAFNRTNPLKVVVWDYLDESVNPNGWYLMSEKDAIKLKHFTREKLNSESDYDKRVRALIFLMFARWSFGFSDWRGMYGSRGS